MPLYLYNPTKVALIEPVKYSLMMLDQLHPSSLCLHLQGSQPTKSTKWLFRFGESSSRGSMGQQTGQWTRTQESKDLVLLVEGS